MVEIKKPRVINVARHYFLSIKMQVDYWCIIAKILKIPTFVVCYFNEYSMFFPEISFKTGEKPNLH